MFVYTAEDFVLRQVHFTVQFCLCHTELIAFCLKVQSRLTVDEIELPTLMTSSNLITLFSPPPR